MVTNALNSCICWGCELSNQYNNLNASMYSNKQCPNLNLKKCMLKCTKFSLNDVIRSAWRWFVWNETCSTVLYDIKVLCWAVYFFCLWYWKTQRDIPEYISSNSNLQPALDADCVWNVMAHAQKPDFVFLRNGRVNLNRRGRQFSRLLAAEVSARAVVILYRPRSEVVWRVLATHSIC